MDKDILAGIPSETEVNLDIGDFQAEDSPTEDQEEDKVEDQKKESEPKSEPDSKEEDDKQEADKPSKKGDNTSSDKKAPFDDHPRFKSMLKSNKELRKEVDELKTEREKRELLETKVNEMMESQAKLTNKDSEQIPKEFVKLFGENQEAYELFTTMTNKQMEAVVDVRLKKLESSKDEEQKTADKTKQHFEKVLADLSEEHGLNLTDEDDATRNAILDVARKYQPTDGKGFIDLEKAYDIWLALDDKKPSNKAKKKVAEIAGDDKSTNTDEEEAPRTFGFTQGKTARDFIN